MVQLEIIAIKPGDCITVGKPHCVTFFCLLHLHHNAPDYRRAQTWRALEEHLDTCPACREWQTQPQPELEEEE